MLEKPKGKKGKTALPLWPTSYTLVIWFTYMYAKHVTAINSIALRNMCTIPEDRLFCMVFWSYTSMNRGQYAW